MAKKKGPVIVYESDVLSYGEYEVGVVGKGQAYEFYKLVYWPSLTARRINSTEFIKIEGFVKESDNIGGIQEYMPSGGYAITTVRCSKFWIYGLTNNNVYNIEFNYNGKSETKNLHSSERIEGKLIFESPELEYTTKTINIIPQDNSNLKFNCLYYEEPPDPVITPIPVSVGLGQMYVDGHIDKCNSNGHDLGIATEGKSMYCETNDLSLESAYRCGLRCWGKGMTFDYTFKGVKFGLYGTITRDDFDISVIELDKKEIARINQNAPHRTDYTLLYESDILPYGEHNVKIRSLDPNKLYELYKLVFWPSLKAKRYNSTDFIKSNDWGKESDGIGGVREYSTTSGKTFDKSFYCSKFWLLGSTAKWNKGFTLTYSDYSKTIAAYSEKRIDNVALEDSIEMPYQSFTMHGQIKGDTTINSVFYTYEPLFDEYINKSYTRCLPYFDILVTSNSIINQISGC